MAEYKVMKRLTLILATLIFVIAPSALPQTPAGDQQKKTDLVEAGLVGPVKSVKTRSLEYGEKITGQGMAKDGDLVVYDQAGRETERRPISDFGEDMGRMSKIFDKQGVLTESSWVDAKGNLMSRDTYSYSDGNLSERLTFDGTGKLVEKTVRNYDARGRVETEVYYDPLKPAARSVFKYDDETRPIEVVFFSLMAARLLRRSAHASVPIGLRMDMIRTASFLKKCLSQTVRKRKVTDGFTMTKVTSANMLATARARKLHSRTNTSLTHAGIG